MKKLIKKINAEFETFSNDAVLQTEKNNKAAGLRARKSALLLSQLFKEFRKESIAHSKKKESN